MSALLQIVHNVTYLPHTVLACWQELVKERENRDVKSDMRENKIRMRCSDCFRDSFSLTHLLPSLQKQVFHET